MAQKLAAAGAFCAVLWTGLDWMVLDRERGNEEDGIELRVWPKLLRATATRQLNLDDAGTTMDAGLTRHDIAHLPGPDEEEFDLNEVGILLSLAAHARHRSHGTRLNRRHLSTVKAASSSRTKAVLAVHISDTVVLGSGSYATAHPASLEPGQGTGATSTILVAKLARDQSRREKEKGWSWIPDCVMGPDSFAAYTRQTLANEASANLLLDDLQGTVLPRLEAWIETDPSRYESADDSGELDPPLLSSTGSSSSLSGQDSQLTSRSDEQPAPWGHKDVRQTPSSPPVLASDSAVDARPSLPPLLDGIVLTWAGHSLSQLALANREGALDVAADLGDPRWTMAPDLRSLLSTAGLTTATAATEALDTAISAALAALHAHGLAHGDASASNICLAAQGPPGLPLAPCELRVQLIDLGSAVWANEVSAEEFAQAKDLDRSAALEVIHDVVTQVCGDEDMASSNGSSRSGSRTPNPTTMEEGQDGED